MHLKHYIYDTINIHFKMKKSSKILLGILTVLPLILFTLYFVNFFSLFLTHFHELENNTGEFPIEFFRSVFGAFIFLILAIVIRLGLMIFYIIHASDNRKKDTTKKIMWILILVFIGTIGSILYFFMEIYPSNDNELAKRHDE